MLIVTELFREKKNYDCFIGTYSSSSEFDYIQDHDL